MALRGVKYAKMAGKSFGLAGAILTGLEGAVGRWFAVDPMAEKGTRWSPYTYAFDNPVYRS